MTSEILNKFEKHLVSLDNLSANTISSYLFDIKKVANYADNLILFVTDEKQVDYYLLNLKNRNYSTSTLSRIISSINMFNSFLYKEGYINNKVKIDIKIKKIDSEKDFVVFTKEEISKILDFEKDDFLSIRDKAIFELVYAIGIKATDCINLLRTDINLDIGYLKYKNNKNEYITVPLNNESINSLKAYTHCLNENNIESDILFVSSTGEAITRQGFWKIFKRRQQQLGLTKELSPTTYRNSLAIHLLEDGISPEDVKEILGLKTINSLKTYLEKMNKNTLLQKVMLNHPRNKINKEI